MSFGAGNHFNNVGFRPGGGSVYWDGDEQVSWPDGGYSTEVYTNKLLEYLETDKDSDEPFFMVAAYTSPHWPLQVPEGRTRPVLRSLRHGLRRLARASDLPA